MIEATVHHYAERQYVMLRDGDRITSAYRVTPEGKLTRIVRWPRELGGDGGGRHEAGDV